MGLFISSFKICMGLLFRASFRPSPGLPSSIAPPLAPLCPIFLLLSAVAEAEREVEGYRGELV